MKEEYIAYVLRNKTTNQYDDGDGNSVDTLYHAYRYSDINMVKEDLSYMDEPEEWEIIKIKSSYEFIEVES